MSIVFFAFFDRFLASRYIADYRDLDNLPHALYTICKRIWQFEADDWHLAELSVQLKGYKDQHLGNYREIYIFIQDKID